MNIENKMKKGFLLLFLLLPSELFALEWIQATAAAGWVARYEHTSVVFDNKMWVMGGRDGNSLKNDVWWSSNGVNWTQATSAAGWVAREGHTSVVFDNKMWVMGGWEDSSLKNDVWWSSNGVSWMRVTTAAGWVAREGHTSVVFDNKMWVMGGVDDITWGPHGWVYSSKNDVWWSSNGVSWTQATSAAGWTARYGHTSVVFDNKMWVMGSRSGNSYKNDVWLTNSDPVLSWTGGPGYESDGVAPDIGTSTMSITYKIKYTDANNDPPASNYPKVIISSGGTNIKTINMLYESGDFLSGAIYSVSTLLSPCSYYEYKFQAYDNYEYAIEISSRGPDIKIYISGYIKDPSNNGMQNVSVNLTGSEIKNLLTDNNGYYNFANITSGGDYTVTPSSFSYYSFTPPSRTYSNLQSDQINQNFTRTNSMNTAALSWLGTANYETKGVDPVFGSTNTLFIYKIKYTDPENDAPATGYPKVHIKKGWPVGVDIVGSPFTMSAEDPGDINYIDSKIYTYSTLLSTGVDYTYYFNTYDIWNTSSTAPAEAEAPDCSNNPTLSFLGTVGYTTDGVSPDFGTSTTTFVFQIKYTDPESNAPLADYPRIKIFKGGAEIAGSPFVMSYISGNYITGAIYKYETALSNVGIDYTYTFEAYDVWNTLADPITCSGPLVKSYIKGYVKDPGGVGMQNITVAMTGNENSVYNTSISGYYEFLVTTMTYFIIPSSFSYYSFTPSSRTYTNIQTHQEAQNFIRDTTAPVLSWTGEPGYETDCIEPNIGLYDSITSYRVKYTDADDDAPASGYPKVIISSGGVIVKTISISYESGNYITGAIYSTSTLLSPCSYYEYSFLASDVWDTVSTTTLLGAGPINKVSITGYCYHPDGVAMPNVMITLTAPGSDATLTATTLSGYYQFTALTPGFNYTITPSSFAYYSFTPSNRTYTKYIDALTNQNFIRNNAVPTLSFTNEEKYKYSSVYPTTGTPLTSNFVFRILYTDTDNDPPINGCQLHISNKKQEITGSPFVMTPNSVEYKNGKTYSCTLTFPYTGSNYSYYYEVKGLWNENVIFSTKSFCISSPPIKSKNESPDAISGGTVVSSKITLKWNANDPDSGDTITYRLYVSEPQTEGNYNLAIKKAPVNMNLIYEGTQTLFVLKNCDPGKTYFWRVDVIDSFGIVTEGDLFTIKTLDIVTTKIFNYPNPFNPGKEKTRIVYRVNEPQTVKIKIYSEYGNLVYDAETFANIGTNEFYYDGKDNNGNTLYNGSYICRVEKIEGASVCYILITK